MPERILITGGAGFIGSNLTRYLVENTDYQIFIIDKLSYATKGFERVRGFPHDRVKVFTWDLVTPISEGIIKELGDISIILHLAAESHVDDSIMSPVPFIHNNVMSTCQILEYARILDDKLKFFLYFNTDEIFGFAPQDTDYKESDKFTPRNPYSASKASGELICMSFANTYNIPLLSLNCMNVFGKMQHVEKFIPKVIKKLLHDETVEIHTYPDGLTAGSRFYIHVNDVARAVLFIMKNGIIGENYNIRGQLELDNLNLAKMIAECMGKKLKYDLVNFHSSRPGHDCRYGLDGTKLSNLGFEITSNFHDNLQEIVDWTLKNLEWLEE